MAIPDQLKSRKLWITIIAGAAVTFAQKFGIELDTDQLISLGLMVAAYVGGQSVVDKQKVKSEIEAGADQLKADANSIIAGLIQKLKELEADAN